MFRNICFYTVLLIGGCNSKQNAPEGVKLVHFPGTDIIQQSVSYAHGKKNGPALEYSRNGVLKARHFFVNDTLNDTSITYYESGRVQSIHVYKNKLKHGCWKEFNKEGKLYSEIFMKNGLLDSTSSIYTYRTGKLLTRVSYRKGIKNGQEEHYYNSGKPKSKVYYDDLGNECQGTEEWYENGEKVKNDFKISITEQNDVLLKNSLIYRIHLENSKPDDKVYQVITPCEGRKIGTQYPLKKADGESYLLEFSVSKGSFVMEKITLAAYRKTAMGNTFIKLTTFNASTNNF